jgi:hypothetical protein
MSCTHLKLLYLDYWVYCTYLKGIVSRYVIVSFMHTCMGWKRTMTKGRLKIENRKLKSIFIWMMDWSHYGRVNKNGEDAMLILHHSSDIDMRCICRKVTTFPGKLILYELEIHVVKEILHNHQRNAWIQVTDRIIELHFWKWNQIYLTLSAWSVQ